MIYPPNTTLTLSELLYYMSDNIYIEINRDPLINIQFSRRVATAISSHKNLL